MFLLNSKLMNRFEMKFYSDTLCDMSTFRDKVTTFLDTYT